MAEKEENDAEVSSSILIEEKAVQSSTLEEELTAMSSPIEDEDVPSLATTGHNDKPEILTEVASVAAPVPVTATLITSEDIAEIVTVNEQEIMPVIVTEAVITEAVTVQEIEPEIVLEIIAVPTPSTAQLEMASSISSEPVVSVEMKEGEEKECVEGNEKIEGGKEVEQEDEKEIVIEVDLELDSQVPEISHFETEEEDEFMKAIQMKEEELMMKVEEERKIKEENEKWAKRLDELEEMELIAENIRKRATSNGKEEEEGEGEIYQGYKHGGGEEEGEENEVGGEDEDEADKEGGEKEEGSEISENNWSDYNGDNGDDNIDDNEGEEFVYNHLEEEMEDIQEMHMTDTTERHNRDELDDEQFYGNKGNDAYVRGTGKGSTVITHSPPVSSSIPPPIPRPSSSIPSSTSSARVGTSTPQDAGEEPYSPSPVSSMPPPIPAGSDKLPIDAYREEILMRIKRDRVTIIHGETGCGKSSRLPVILLEDAEKRGAPCRMMVSVSLYMCACV